jgi:hypothetical protein
MSNTEQRKQWAEHMGDEARALEVQQQAAGVTHSPLERPLPHSKDDLVGAVADAVRAERERCAGIADSWRDEGKLLGAFAGLTQAERRAAAAIAAAIGSEMRRGT